MTICVLLLPAITHAQPASTAHLDLMRIWQHGVGTPENMALLPLAEEEGKVALLHVNLALDSVDDRVAMLTHLGHAIHAIDPAQEADGPGKGYGLMRAAVTILAQMQLARSREDASANVDYWGEKVMLSADHVVQAAREARNLAKELRDSPAAQESAEQRLILIRDYVSTALSGSDANSDGEIDAAEGGLRQMREAMARLIRVEGF